MTMQVFCGLELELFHPGKKIQGQYRVPTSELTATITVRLGLFVLRQVSHVPGWPLTSYVVKDNVKHLIYLSQLPSFRSIGLGHYVDFAIAFSKREREKKIPSLFPLIHLRETHYTSSPLRR